MTILSKLDYVKIIIAIIMIIIVVVVVVVVIIIIISITPPCLQLQVFYNNYYWGNYLLITIGSCSLGYIR